MTSLFQENGIVKGVHYKTKDGQEHKSCAPLTIVCDGGFSNLRRSLCNPKVKFSFVFYFILFYWLQISLLNLFILINIDSIELDLF